MAGILQHLRSSTLDKRPNPGSMVDGQVAINYASGSPGLFFKDSAGALVKVGPVHVGTTAPNVSPASGGTAGNSRGEQWLDTSGGSYVMKIWDGSAWRTEAGEFVNATGDIMTGALGMPPASAGSPTIYFSGDTDTGLYSPGANQLAITTSGTGRLFVASDGKVGIGTASVSNAMLHVSSSVAAAAIKSEDTGAAGSFVRILGDASSQNLINWKTGTSLRFASSDDNYGSFAEALRITSDGKVGIGTNSPQSLLDAQGDVSITGNENYLYLYSTATVGSNARARIRAVGAGGGSGYGGDFRVSTRTSSNTWNTDAFVVDNQGKVGIGTSSPGNFSASNLVVEAATAAGITISEFTGGGNAAICFAGTSAFPEKAKINCDVANATLEFSTAGSPRARIDTSGRLLVGTSSSRQVNASIAALQLQIEGTTYQSSSMSLVTNQNAVDSSYIVLGKSRGTSLNSSTIVNTNDLLGAFWFCGADGTDLKRGATIEAFVDGTPGANDMPGRLVFSTTADGASSPTERMRITNDGNTMINSTAYTYARLGIGGYANGDRFGVDMRPSADGATPFSFNNASGTSVGSITTTASATAFNTSSDYRLKENVTAVTDGITRLQQLRPSRFNFIADPDKTVDGFIAHEVQTVVPEAIAGEKDAVDDEGNPVYQGIDQSKLVPLLTAALQEAIGEIESLKARVAALEAS